MNTLKSYKLVNSKEVQEKAFRLGYWFCGKEFRHTNKNFLFMFSDGSLAWDNSVDYYGRNKATEITQADFLALPEPLKVGDWVKCDNGVGDCFISAITTIVENSYRIAFNNAYWYTRELTKLTPEQIKVLQLEE